MKLKILACNILAIGRLVASSSTTTTITTVSTSNLIEVQEQDVVNGFVVEVQEKEARVVNQTATNMIGVHEEQEENAMKHLGLRGGSNTDSRGASFERTLRDLEAAFERDLQLCSPKNGPCVYDSACCGRMQCIIRSGDSTGTCKSRRVGGINNINCRLRDETCQTDWECCGGLDCKNNRCFGEFTGYQRCGERSDSCLLDLDCCSGLICSEFEECIIDDFICSELFESCVRDDDCCSGLECDGRQCRTRRNNNNRDCVLAGEFCRSDSECCSDELDSLVCFSRVCRPFTTETNACVGRGRFCVDDFDCCGGFEDGGLFCASDNTCQREASAGCSTAAGANCLSNEDCCGGNLQCAPNGRCTRIYTGVGYP